eukprot:TRINITY_DN22805_c0_g1_i1.p1 TRINITY_DN22805_c0_g1~~TRINITY_DN22805_c0_g1_i1.p1  ORF type:complete len:164 (-),score=8.91 TRINITY_DN22805_c0_g1_i1:73-564(-)
MNQLIFVTLCVGVAFINAQGSFQTFVLEFVGPIEWIDPNWPQPPSSFIFTGKATTQTITTIINPFNGVNASVSGVQAGARAFMQLVANVTGWDQSNTYFISSGNLTFGHEANNEGFDLAISSLSLEDGMWTGDVVSSAFSASASQGKFKQVCLANLLQVRCLE